MDGPHPITVEWCDPRRPPIEPVRIVRSGRQRQEQVAAAAARRPTTAGVAVVTDSAADLPSQMAASARIRVVPLTVRFGAEELRDGVDLSTEQFWNRLQAPGAPYPTTASPPPGLFRQAFESCFADGAGAIVCPTIGSRLSATFQSATLAAAVLPDQEIYVIDTRSTSMATGYLALLAAEMADAAIPAAQIASRLRDRLADLDLFVALDTLGYLRKGGRLSTPQAALGTILSIKPIITVRDGLVVVAERPRTRSKARERVIELATARPLERLAIMHTPSSSNAEVAEFRDRLVARVPGGIDPGHVIVGVIGATTGPHLGPGMIGAVLLARPGTRGADAEDGR